VKHGETPVLDARDSAGVFDELRARCPAYVPEWIPVEDGMGQALLRIVARYAEVAIARLNQSPDKNRLAFLDTLGISLIPAQPARAVAVFQPMPLGVDSRIAAGTQVGAQAAGQPEPVLFEVESGIAVAAARLVEVATMWPARDEYADHSAEATGGQPFTLFDHCKSVSHELYLAHDTLFAFSNLATVEIEFELAMPGSAPIDIAWTHWDGQVWRPFSTTLDGTEGLTRSGVVRLRAECGQSVETTIDGVKAHWIRGRVQLPLPPDPARVLPEVDRVRVRTAIGAAGLLPDAAFADSQKLDLSSTFFPFGQQPQPGSAFYFSSQEAFSRPGAHIIVSAEEASTPQDSAGEGSEPCPPPKLATEYWNGTRWASLAPPSDGNWIVLPMDVSATSVNGENGFWLRIRIVEGGFARTRQIQWDSNKIVVVENVPPALCNLSIGYDYHSPWEQPQHCLTYSDFRFERHSDDVRRPGSQFTPFHPVHDTTPALYLGFDRPLPNDLVSLYLDIQESDAATPPVIWEAWNGDAWRELTVTDETEHLRRPGLVSFIPPDVPPRPQANVSQTNGDRIVTSSATEAARFRPGDLIVVEHGKDRESATVRQVDGAAIRLESPLLGTYHVGSTLSLAPLPRFGTPRDWVRARLKVDGAPAESLVNGIYPNGVWVVQAQTVQDEVLGSSTGQPNQPFFFAQTPLLHGEQIEVRELAGARAEVELPILQEELAACGLMGEDIRTTVDRRTGRIKEVWIRWQARPHLLFSGPDDRHYVVERARGRLIFGDGCNGRIPPPGRDNVRAGRYRAGGGVIGNVPSGAINQLLGAAAFAKAVTNPAAADGGADGESPEMVKTRGPRRLRHHGSALAACDYEALACEASPGVAMARTLPATAPNGRPAPGWVTVTIVPQSLQPQPTPSFELRRRVHDYLIARAPATLAASRIAIIAPNYLPIGVSAVVIPQDAGEAGAVEDRVQAVLERFLHPLTGGPVGHGWPFGRDVYLSDVAAVLEAVPGVDYVERLDLLLDDVPVGERVRVPADRIVVAGPIRVEMRVTGGTYATAAS